MTEDAHQLAPFAKKGDETAIRELLNGSVLINTDDEEARLQIREADYVSGMAGSAPFMIAMTLEK